MDLDEQTLADTMESLTDEFDTKAENIVMVVKHFEGNVEAIDNELKRLTARKKTISNKAETLKQYLKDNMEVLDRKKIERDLFTISVLAGKPMLEVTDETKIPESFFVVSTPQRSLDRKALLDKLKQLPEGEVIEGATIGTSKTGLRIY